MKILGRRKFEGRSPRGHPNTVYSSDDSFKDIGVHKAAKIKRLTNIEEEIENFNSAWKDGVKQVANV
jgi:hypothetical protein